MGFTLSFFNFDRIVPIAGDFYGEVVSPDNIQLLPESREPYASELTKLPDLYKSMTDRLHAAYSKAAQRYNLRQRPISFRPGDKVWKKK